MGREERTNFMSMRFPAMVIHWPPEALIFALIFFMISSHWGALVIPRVKNSPKYLILSQEAKPLNPRD
jgi:hypothetical protein